MNPDFNTMRKTFGPRRTQMTRGGLVIMIVMSLGFIAGGGFMLYLAGSGYLEYCAMKSWRESSARILQAHVTTSRGSKGRSTFGIAVQYEYSYGGTTHRGTRADLFPKTTDSGGEYQHRIVNELEAARKSKRFVPCFVNPANPAEAVLYRQMRWGIFALLLGVGLLFFAVGGGLVTYAFWLRRQTRLQATLRQQLPGQPWLWEREWVDGRIRSSSKSGAIFLTIFALVWNAIANLPLLFMDGGIFTHGSSVVSSFKRQPIMLLILLFPLAGIGLIIAAVRAWIVWSVFGNAVFTMTRFPASIGGTLVGTIGSRCTRRPTSDVRLTLSGLRGDLTGEARSTSILWQDSRVVRPEAIVMTPDGLVIPVLFQIPTDCSPSDRDTGFSWQLELQGSFGGTAATACFNVPVFRVENDLPELLPGSPAVDRFYMPPSPDEILKQTALSIEPLPAGGRRYVFHANHPLSQALSMTLFVLIWTGVCAALWHFLGLGLFAIVFSLADLFLIYGLCDLMLWSGSVEVSRQGALCRGGIFVKALQPPLAADEIRRFQVDLGMSQGNKMFYNLKLETTAGKKITLAKRLRERSHGEWLIEQMEQDLGRSEAVHVER